jgi:hypothetical protein
MKARRETPNEKALRLYEIQIGLVGTLPKYGTPSHEFRDFVQDCAPCFIQKVRQSHDGPLYLFLKKGPLTKEQLRHWRKLDRKVLEED